MHCVVVWMPERASTARSFIGTSYVTIFKCLYSMKVVLAVNIFHRCPKQNTYQLLTLILNTSNLNSYNCVVQKYELATETHKMTIVLVMWLCNSLLYNARISYENNYDMREYFLHESSLAFTSHVLRFSVNSLHDVPARSAPISHAVTTLRARTVSLSGTMPPCPGKRCGARSRVKNPCCGILLGFV